MKQIYFITGNKSKFEEAKMILRDVELIQKDLKLIEPRTFNQEEVVKSKAEQAFSILKQPVIVDDTGIFFEAYNNFPGTFTKYFFEAVGFEGIQNLLKNKDRKAFFLTTLCYKDSEAEKIFNGEWKGMVIEQVSGRFNPDWQYNSIFIPEGFINPLAEIPMEIRAEQSHRKKALYNLRKYLMERK